MKNKLVHTAILLAVLFGASAARAARPDRAVFLSTKEEIRCLAVERIRSAGADYERVIVRAETRLRDLHENYQVAGGTPPTRLDGDLGELRGACQKEQRLVTAGRAPPADPAARSMVERKWGLFREEFNALLRRIEDQKREGWAESRIYWESLHTFDELSETIATNLLFNTPPKERGLEEALSRDKGVLLKACESAPKKSRGATPRIVVPHEHAGASHPDVQAFYRALDLVPQARPLRSGSFTVPPGSRTVTLRENAGRLVFRPMRGKGIAYLGQSETELSYEYVAVPPDTAYYFENTGTEPLELDFVSVKP
ncbi:MAG: hypothetical protein IPP35_07270 [Elusimicrobia bacterium]|nr:hypothetical protein [Elusimicrobiota bacterium]